ncbi:MAG: hypothetical protein N2C12_05610, partial [Planctomycetales bacterium]
MPEDGIVDRGCREEREGAAENLTDNCCCGDCNQGVLLMEKHPACFIGPFAKWMFAPLLLLV